MKEICKFTYKRAVWCVAMILMTSLFAFAQTETGRIEGTVTDATGAVVTGATVVAISAEQNARTEVTTNEEGFFTIPSLRPGIYTLDVSAANFSRSSRTDIQLQISQVARIDVQLQPGNVSETIEVSGGAPLIESGTSAIGEVIQGRQIVELPLNGRNVLELARLTPGVTQGVPSGFATGVGGNAETFRQRNTGGAALSVNGQRTQANNFLLDGVDNNESLVNTIQIFPQADAVQEFRVQTSVAPAEFGRGGGGIVNATIRSGRNDFFGSAFVFLRNDEFDARPTFQSVNPEFRRGQFGGTFGGPLYLPRFGEGGRATTGGRNRLFFFGDYEGLRQFLPLGRDIATVPTEAFRRGDFSALLNPAVSGLDRSIQLTDPLTGLPVPGNRLDLLPGNRINPVGLNYLNAFPLPNRGGTSVLGNYENTRVELLNQDTFDIRVDGNVTDSNQIFGRVSYGRAIQETTSRLTTLPSGFGSGSNFTRTRAAVVGLTSVITSSLVNEFRAQASRINFGYQPPFFDTPVSANLGIPNANLDALRGGGALIGGFNGQLEYTGDFGLYTIPQNTYQLVDSLSYTTGNHTFRFGGTLLRREVNLFRPRAGKGFFFLVGNGDADGVRITGFEQSDLLIGFTRNYQIGPQFGTVGTRNWENALFIQDDWRVTRNLTLNLGLRYERFTNPTEVAGRQANFDINTGRLIVASGSGDPLVENDSNDFSPRIGFAYDIGSNGRTVLRGGYGLFYFLDRGGIDNQLAQNPPFGGIAAFDYRNGFRFTLSGRAPNNSNDSRLATGSLPTTFENLDLNNPQNVNVLAILPDNKTANVQQFNIQLQRQLTDETAVSVAYVGTRGRNLSIYYNLNGSFVGRPSSQRPFPNLGDVNVRDDEGRSSYDSLQVQLERRFTRGFQYLLAYTFSKTKDNSLGAFDSPGIQNVVNLDDDFGRSNIDFPHVFSFSTLYEIPFGRGRRFGSDIPRVLNFFIGGFQINSILRLQSGQAFDVRNNGALVDVVGDPYNAPDGRYLNPAAFQSVPTVDGAPTRIGNLERNGLRGRPFRTLNFGLSKNFAITERARIQFRTEFFNLTNTPQFNTPNTNINDANNFGRIQGTQGFTNRQIQFGLRLEF